MARRLPIEQWVARRVRSLREAQGLTQAELARLADTSRSQVAALERGDRSPTISTLALFASGLGISLSELLAEGGTVSVNPPQDAAGRIARTLRQRGTTYTEAVDRVIASLDKVAQEAKRSAGGKPPTKRSRS